MKSKVQVFAVAFAVVALLAAGVALPAGYAQAQAQTPTTNPPIRSITVSGTGQVSVQPDTAVVVIGVKTQNAQANQALTQNNQQMNALINSLKQAGIPNQNIQTQYIQLQPVYSNQNNANTPQQVTGYTATNTVQVRVTDLTNLGSILDTAVQSGGNLIQNIRFEVSNPEPIMSSGP